MPLVKPCNNCKNVQDCEVFRFVTYGFNKLGPWQLAQAVESLPGFTHVVHITKSEKLVELECQRHRMKE